MVRKSDKITKNINHRGTKAILGPAHAGKINISGLNLVIFSSCKHVAC